MTQPSARDAAWYALHDPATDASALAAIAQEHPEFAAVIAQHPNAYSELRAWALEAQQVSVQPVAAQATAVAASVSAGASAVAVGHAHAAADPAASAPPVVEPVREAAPAPAPFIWEKNESEPPKPPKPKKPSWWSRLDKRGRLIASVSVAVVAVLVVGGTIFGVTAAAQAQAQAEARRDYDWAVADLGTASLTLAESVDRARARLSTTSRDAVADPATFDGLERLVQRAGELDVAKPRANITQTDALRSQASFIADKTRAAYDLSNEIDEAIGTVNDSIQTRIVEKVSPNATYTIEATDGNGNKERITLRIGSWVRGSDAALLDQAWAAAGGEGTMPLSADPDGFTSADAAFVFGTVTVENLTTDFPAANFGNGTSWVFLRPRVPDSGWASNWQDPSGAGLGMTMQARQYGSGATANAIGSRNPLVAPDMSALDENGTDRWGPVPFVIGIDTVFTPNNPDGNPSLDEIRFSLESALFIPVTGDTTFQVGRSW